MLRAKIFYFIYYAALASLSPFLPLYYRDLGFSGAQIGVLTGLPPVVGLISSPLWSGVADASRRHGLVLGGAIAGAGVCVGMLLFHSAYAALIPIVCFYAFFLAPVSPLVDNAVLDRLGHRRDAYGRQRLWGTVGWGVSGAVAGLGVEAFGLRSSFLACVVLMAVLFFASLGLAAPSAARSDRTSFGEAFRRLMRDRRWIVLLATVFVLGMCSSALRNFLFIHVKQMGGGERLIGMSLPIAVIGELPVFFFADRMLRRWGARGMLMFSIAAFALQAMLFSLMGEPWLLLPFTILHGPSFSAQLTARITYAREIAPESLGATAQGLINGASSGLASSCGAVVGGAIFDGFGAPFLFRAASLTAVACLVFFSLSSSGDREAPA